MPGNARLHEACPDPPGNRLAAATLAGCGGAAPITPTPTAPTSAPASATPATATPVTASPTPLPSVPASVTPTPLVAVLEIKEYDVAITLPTGVADATYRIDASMAVGNADVNGNPITELPGAGSGPRA